jgi:DNA mismatch repair protein MutS
MAGFTSVLFTEPGAATGIDELTPGECFGDLHLDQVIAAITRGTADEHLDRFFYLRLHDVSAVMYRHEIFRDLESDEIRAPIETLIAGMRTMRERLRRARQLWHRLQQQGWFVHAVEAFCDTITTLREDLSQVDPSSRGLREFADYVGNYVDGERFQSLVADTAAVQSALHKIRYTVHIEGLKVHVDRYSGQSDYSRDIAATFERFASPTAKDYHVLLKEFADMNHVEEHILECVATLYPDEFRQLDRFCTHHRSYLDATVSRFDREVNFYLAYLQYMRRFTDAGLRFSYPRITTDPGLTGVDNAFDLALATKFIEDGNTVVCNTFALSGRERIFVVTGPNQGGKTTFARTVGQLAYLAALGCPVPASRATLTLPDEIYTHFKRQENVETLRGKLDNELVRINEILSRASAESIIVMNESFASTTVDDSLLIGSEVLQRIIRLGSQAVYVTFLDELAGLDHSCVSVVANVAADDPTQRTFTITRRPADGLAYAAALADRYALNSEVLVRRISQ